MRCRGVDEREVGGKCGCMEGCYVVGRPAVRSCRNMVTAAAYIQTNRGGATVRQFLLPPPLARGPEGEYWLWFPGLLPS